MSTKGARRSAGTVGWEEMKAAAAGVAAARTLQGWSSTAVRATGWQPSAVSLHELHSAAGRLSTIRIKVSRCYGKGWG